MNFGNNFRRGFQGFQPQAEGAIPMFSQGQGMGPPQAPPMFSQGQGTQGLPTQGPPQGATGGAAPAGASGVRPEDAEMFLKLRGMKPEQQAIARQRELSDMLRSQSRDNLKGQMVSGHYVAPGWGDLAGNIATTAILHNKDAAGEARLKEMAGQESDAARQWFEAVTGKKMSTPQPTPAPGSTTDAAGGAAGGINGLLKMLGF